MSVSNNFALTFFAKTTVLKKKGENREGKFWEKKNEEEIKKGKKVILPHFR